MKLNRDALVGALELVAVAVAAVSAALGHRLPALESLLAGLGITGVHHLGRGVRRRG